MAARTASNQSLVFKRKRFSQRPWIMTIQSDKTINKSLRVKQFKDELKQVTEQMSY